ncbi:MAG: hypothetical protein WA231_09885 [Methylocella sp.]
MSNEISEAAARGKYLADRLRDTTMIEAAIETMLEDMEILVGLWDEAIASGVAIAELEKINGFSQVQINRWRNPLNNDRRRSKFASELFITAYASFLGLTRCQARTELSRRERAP